MAVMIKKNAGFTLIEIMLVVVLISLSAVTVIVNLPEKKEDIAKEEAQRFFYRLQLLNEHAILNGEDLGIRVDTKNRTYTYMKLTGEGWKIFSNKVYVDTQLPEEIEISIELGSSAWSKNESLFKQESLFDEEMFAEYEDEKKVKPPQLFVLASGEITPFHLSIYPKDELEKTWSVYVKESGAILLTDTKENDAWAISQ